MIRLFTFVVVFSAGVNAVQFPLGEDEEPIVGNVNLISRFPELDDSGWERGSLFFGARGRVVLTALSSPKPDSRGYCSFEYATWNVIDSGSDSVKRQSLVARTRDTFVSRGLKELTACPDIETGKYVMISGLPKWEYGNAIGYLRIVEAMLNDKESSWDYDYEIVGGVANDIILDDTLVSSGLITLSGLSVLEKIECGTRMALIFFSVESAHGKSEWAIGFDLEAIPAAIVFIRRQG